MLYSCFIFFKFGTDFLIGVKVYGIQKVNIVENPFAKSMHLNTLALEYHYAFTNTFFIDDKSYDLAIESLMQLVFKGTLPAWYNEYGKNIP